jgi:hypothetical protein
MQSPTPNVRRGRLASFTPTTARTTIGWWVAPMRRTLRPPSLWFRPAHSKTGIGCEASWVGADRSEDAEAVSLVHRLEQETQRRLLGRIRRLREDRRDPPLDPVRAQVKDIERLRRERLDAQRARQQVQIAERLSGPDRLVSRERERLQTRRAESRGRLGNEAEGGPCGFETTERGELEPSPNRCRGAMLSEPRTAAQGMVEPRHGSVHIRFPLRQIEQRALAVRRQGQPVQVAAADADRVGV